MYISNIGPQYTVTFHTSCETELEGSKKRVLLEWEYANKINKGQRPCLQQESLLQAP